MPLLERITIDPDICHGKPCIRGLRYPVETLLELMSSGMTSTEILADYPDLETEDLRACLVYATRLAKTRSSLAEARRGRALFPLTTEQACLYPQSVTSSYTLYEDHYTQAAPCQNGLPGATSGARAGAGDRPWATHRHYHPS